MNRQQRRAQKPVKKPAWHKLTNEQRIERIVQNGITLKDLEENYNRGYDAATKQLSTFYQKEMYSALAIALKRRFKFGKQRIVETLELMQRIILEELTSDDLIEKCAEETGVTIGGFEPDKISDFEV